MDVTALTDITHHARFAVAVDVVALSVRKSRLHVVLVEREGEPFAGQWALPGVIPGPDEALEDAAARALSTKAGLVGHIEQLKSYYTPERDPRMPVLSVAYVAFLSLKAQPSAGRHTTAARWVEVQTAGGRAVVTAPSHMPVAFDHADIVADGVERAASKLEWTPLATAFLEDTFTITDIRQVYEAIWGQPLSPPNFHRKAISTFGFIQPAKGKRCNAQLYQRGRAVILDPPVNRLSTIERGRKAVGMS